MSEVPGDLKFTKTHEWIRVTGESAIMGITDFAQEELHEIVYVELPKIGLEIKRGDEFAAVESVKARSEIYSPVSGKIIKINEALVGNDGPSRPELMNEDPYGDGWMIEIQLSNKEELNEQLYAEEYGEFLKTQG